MSSNKEKFDKRLMEVLDWKKKIGVVKKLTQLRKYIKLVSNSTIISMFYWLFKPHEENGLMMNPNKMN